MLFQIVSEKTIKKLLLLNIINMNMQFFPLIEIKHKVAESIVKCNPKEYICG